MYGSVHQTSLLCSPRGLPRPAEALAKHFDPAHIDDSLGGQIPIAQLWSFDLYGQRMADLDAQASAALASAAAPPSPAAGGRSPLPSDSATELGGHSPGGSGGKAQVGGARQLTPEETAAERALEEEFERNVVVM